MRTLYSLIFITATTFAAELWMPPAPNLPEVLATFPGGELRADTFRAAVERIARSRPIEFDIPDAFFVRMCFEMLKAESPSVKIDESSVAAQIAARQAEIGQSEFPISRTDLERDVRFMMYLKALKTTPEDLIQRYSYTWLGQQSAIAARINGREFTFKEIVDFCILYGREYFLQRIYESALLIERMKADLRAKGISDSGVEQDWLVRLYPKELSIDAMKQWYHTNKESFTIMLVEHIFIPYNTQQPYLPSKPTNEIQRQTQSAAERVLMRLRAGESIAAVAKEFPYCPSAARGGRLGWLAHDAEWAALLPAYAYRLDTFDNVNPIVHAPHPEIYLAAKSLKDGELSGIVITSSGYSVLRRVSTRIPKNADSVLVVGATLLGQEKRSSWIEELERTRPVKRIWTPSGN